MKTATLIANCIPVLIYSPIIPFLIKFNALICFSLRSLDFIISNVSDPGEYLINPFCSARLKTNSLSPLTGITIESLYLSLNRAKFLSAPSTSTLFATIKVGFEILRRCDANFLLSTISKSSKSFSSRLVARNVSLT